MRWSATNPVDDRPHTVLWRGSQTHIRDVQIVRYALKKLDRMGVRIVFAGADYRKELGVPKAVLLDDLLLRHEDERWRTEAKKHRKGGRIQLSGLPIPEPPPPDPIAEMQATIDALLDALGGSDG